VAKKRSALTFLAYQETDINEKMMAQRRRWDFEPLLQFANR
jgi:hypothetical protein